MILSVLAAWIVTSLLFSLLWGAVIRRGMEGPRRTGHLPASASTTAEHLDSNHVPFMWPSRTISEPLYSSGDTKETRSYRDDPSLICKSTYERCTDATSSRVAWPKCQSSLSENLIFPWTSPLKKKSITSGSLCQEQTFSPRFRFVLSLSCR